VVVSCAGRGIYNSLRFQYLMKIYQCVFPPKTIAVKYLCVHSIFVDENLPTRRLIYYLGADRFSRFESQRERLTRYLSDGLSHVRIPPPQKPLQKNIVASTQYFLLKIYPLVD